MTIAISVRVGEGLVYSADSTSSLFETINDVPRLAQSFHHAQKLMQLADYPIGIMTFGLGLIGSRNVESLVAEYETTIPPFDALPVVPDAPEGYTVEQLAVGLRDFLQAKYEAVHQPPPPALPDTPAPADPRPQMGVIVGGYSSGQFYPDEFLIRFPAGTVERARAEDAAFGILWWGVTDPIFRLYFGTDLGFVEWLVAKGVELEVAEALFEEARSRFSWNILYDGMPLQDAIDMSVYFANVTIGHSRFVVGPPVCGGHVDVATITHRGFSWVRQKKSVVKSDSVFF